MSEAIDSREIRYELSAIREDLDFINGHIIDEQRHVTATVTALLDEFDQVL